MDTEWLREWSADKCNNPPKTLRQDVGTLLAELDAARARIAELEGGIREPHFPAPEYEGEPIQFCDSCRVMWPCPPVRPLVQDADR